LDKYLRAQASQNSLSVDGQASEIRGRENGAESGDNSHNQLVVKDAETLSPMKRSNMETIG
jgi:hypothetical protein